MEQWSARALARQLGLPASTVSHWISTDLVEPDKRGRGRCGHSIGVAGLLELLAVRDLREAGIPVRKIRLVIANLRQITGHERPLAPLMLVVIGNDVFIQDEEDPGVLVSALRHPTQRVMVFPIGEQHAHVLGKLRDSVVVEIESEKETRHVA